MEKENKFEFWSPDYRFVCSKENNKTKMPTKSRKKKQMKTESKIVREQFGSLQRGHGQDWRMKLLSKAKGMTTTTITTTASSDDEQTRL